METVAHRPRGERHRTLRPHLLSIYVTDPDGLILEIATYSPGWTVDEPFEQLGTNVLLPPEEKTARGRDEKAIAAATWPEPVVEISDEMSVKRLHHISAMASDIFRTTDFYPELLGFKVVKRTVNFDDTAWPHLYFAVGDYSPGTVVTYFGYGPNVMRYGTIGTSLTQHMAFAVKDAEAQLEWREKLLSKDVQVTTVLERKYFTSISFNDPDGHILEIATLGPGFFVDENRQELGTHLMLPEWLEPQRSRIEQELVPHS